MNAISVNEAIDRVAELDGQDIVIHGQFIWLHDDIALHHVPKKQRRKDKSEHPFFTSSIWVNFDWERIGLKVAEAQRLSWSHVSVKGVLKGPEAGYVGCGHFGCWPAKIEAHEVHVVHSLKDISRPTPLARLHPPR